MARDERAFFAPNKREKVTETLGAPIGNQNARKRHWSEAIKRAVEEEDPIAKRRRIDALADRLIAVAMEGDVQAMKEIGDRLEGKPSQVIAGDPESPVGVEFSWKR